MTRPSLILLLSLSLCVTAEAGQRKHDANGNDIRPRLWCGYWLRHHLGVPDRRLNLARNWVHYGSPAGGPAPGVIAVWPHHVGLVTGVPSPGKIILLSGNDGHAVRERERSTRGIIAYRTSETTTASLLIESAQVIDR